MNQFSIKDIENLSGIKAHTLRIWEQRYQILVPKRKESKHRIYDNEDLKHILRIAYLYHGGLKISKIARLKKEELKKLALDKVPTAHFVDVFINQLMEASIDFDEERFEKVFNSALVHLGFEKCILQVAYPFLERLGILWMSDNVIPAQEHFASNIIKRKILVAIDGLDIQTSYNNDLTVLFAPEGEHHEIPLLIMQYLIKKNGNRTVYFGVNVPLEDLQYYASKTKIQRLFMHVITNLSNKEMDEIVADICNSFPAMKVVLSGPLTKQVQNLPINLTMLQSLDEMMDYPKTIHGSHNSLRR